MSSIDPSLPAVEAGPNAIEQIEARLEFLRAHYTEQYPEVKVLVYELARMRAAQLQKAFIRTKDAETAKTSERRTKKER